VITVLSLSLLLLGAQAPPDTTAGPAVAAARSALAGGQPWRASRLLAPVLRDSAGRTPEVVLLAAEAASRWDGWREVERLLAGAGWLDAREEGRGRELLARAALDRGADSVAVGHARLAVADAAPAARGVRLVLLARAYDRLEQRDSAAAVYARAALALPAIADWLAFRQVAVTGDSAARSAVVASIGSAIARERLPLAEAQARERAGDLRGAADRFAALGSWGDAFRLRYAADSGTAARSRLRTEIVAFIAAHSGSGDARAAAGVLDSFGKPTPREDLIVGRSLAESGPASRAAAALGRALKAGQGTVRDRYAYAQALFDRDRYADAAFQFNLVRAPAPLAASAAYARGRALVRGGQVSEGRSALREVLRRHARYADAAVPALLLLADLAADERRDPAAREALLDVVRRYPKHPSAPSALFRAAIIAFAAGDMRVAARELDSLGQRYPASGDASAAEYWAARALAAAGDTAGAARRWRELAAGDPLSYYAAAAAGRLGQAPWAPPAAADSFVRFPDLDSALARTALLQSAGMDREARWEEDRLARLADSSVERLLSTAAAFRSRGRASRAVALTWRAIGRGAPRDARTFRLLFPVTGLPALEASARDQHIDPAFLAALIRQESIFNPAATSPAGARGLMQIMPSVGRRLARAAAFPLWDPVLLYQPDVNLELGTRHLAELLRRYPQEVRALAAYNAGATPVELWSAKIGMADEELFAERIPYRETRDYVRIIQRNESMYRALYGLTAQGAPAGL
jgi:soluble lytic murein transglycosylase